ncbi:hypothetical protein [Nocardiopsis ganjiahuensis]|uniref:hypothetical protein n=1 Tax=Nocardiopsis ganjiahuensis TaxID=239984 RepID=UPI000347E529|nr:hypothetical protein [Nocardiopsis ganjiahuensis]
MARIVCVHGIAQQVKGAHTLLADWYPALADGAALAEVEIDRDDVAMAFYGDLFRPKGHRMIGLPEYDSSDVAEGLEQDLLRALWEEAARSEPAVPGPNDPVRFGAPTWVQRALRSLSQHPYMAGVADRVMVADLKQVRAYLTEPEVRETARGRVQELVGPDTRLVVAHSLGSVVAYEALCARFGDFQVDLLTLGSPLGISGLIFDRLVPAPEQGQGVRPAAVREWTNVADRRDVVALVKELEPLFGRVRDRPVHNGAKAHDASPYLTSIEAGEAVRAALSG